MSQDAVFDVAIVGYGPAGVVAAGLLGQAGLKVYVCERLTEVYQIPRAIALDHEIMRVFQQLGVVDAVAPYCEPFTPSEYFGVDGQLIRRMTMVEPPYPQGYTPSIVFTQPKVEQVLRDRVAQLPNVQVELGVEMRRIEQDTDGVRLEIANGAVKTVRARYVIACDGGSSTVRTQLDMPLEDLDFDEPWLVVDVLVNERGLAKLPTTSVQYCEPERPCTIVIGPANHRRWEISLKPGEDARQAATPEATWKLLSRWLTPEDGELWRQSSYRFHALVAERWREGRVFLAGDAAHMQPPFLGQGMCQGVRDVTNLAWKLVSVLRGDVRGATADALLDSYGIERKAHVRELTSRIKGVGAVICERDPVKARARDAKILAECGGVVKDTPRQDILPRLEGGLLSAQASSARGSLFPQPRLKSGKRMDEVLGNGWRLVLAAGVAAPKVSRIRVLALGETGETEGVAAAWFRKHECVAALVRPDNYVYGVAATAAGVDALIQELTAALT
jgi:3-(3-hydroxy-phenyl)propionate hydroxylase